MAGRWISRAIRHPGALREQLGAEEGKPIPASRLAAEEAKLHAAAGRGKLTEAQRTKLRRINLAQTLRKMHK